VSTLPVSDNIEGTVIGDDIEVEGYGRVAAVYGKVENVIVGWHFVKLSDKFHGLGVCSGVLG
jgi:hypothetical protein